MLLPLTAALFLAAATTPPAASPKPAVRPAASHPALSACALVTHADVVQVLGLVVAKGEEQGNETASTCDYSARRSQVSVTVQRLQQKLNIPAEMSALKASIPGSATREAGGLGTDAFFLDIPGAGTQLYVLHGDSEFLMLSLLGFGEAAQVSPAAEALARKALGRL